MVYSNNHLQTKISQAAHSSESRQASRPKRKMSTGLMVLGTVAGLTAVGGFLADWNKTHLFNSEWPPHAKFHDAWSITLGSFLGVSGLYFLLRKGPERTQDINLGAALPAFYWAAQGISFAFPGAKGMEAEFPELVPKIGGVWLNEKYASAAMLTLSGIGYALERMSASAQQNTNN